MTLSATVTLTDWTAVYLAIVAALLVCGVYGLGLLWFAALAAAAGRADDRLDAARKGARS